MNKKHIMKCNNCGQEMDLRDLGQVFAHEECEGVHVDYSKLEKLNTSAVKVGEPFLYIGDKSICIN